MTPPDVLISEVGPRDGLQSVKATMPTADKLRWIDALYAAGVREIEVASFVPARLLPQMADAAEVVRHAATLPGLVVMALVPNRKGAQAGGMQRIDPAQLVGGGHGRLDGLQAVARADFADHNIGGCHRLLSPWSDRLAIGRSA